MRNWDRKYITSALKQCNSFVYPRFYRHVFDDKTKRVYKKNKLLSDISVHLAYAYGYKPNYARQNVVTDSFTNDSGKLICCPYTKLIKVNVRDHGDIQFPVPCGKCPYCLHKKQNEWIFRSRNELMYSRSAWFITLTFAPEFLPADGKVNKRDIQLFFKRFRKLFKFKVRLKYYTSAEYGGKTGRPHYHILLFFKDINPTQKLLRRLLEKSWTFGFIDLQPMNLNTVCYVTKYVNKLSNYYDKEYYDDSEFRLVSKQFGLEWFYHNKGPCRSRLSFRYDNKKRNGKKKRYTVPLPRYYRDKAFNKAELHDILLNYLTSDSYKQKIKIFGNRDYSLFNRLQYLKDKYFYEGFLNYQERMSYEKL